MTVSWPGFAHAVHLLGLPVEDVVSLKSSGWNDTLVESLQTWTCPLVGSVPGAVTAKHRVRLSVWPNGYGRAHRFTHAVTHRELCMQAST